VFTGLMYIMLGILFTYLAINSGDDTIWGIKTLLPALIATFDFVVGIRFLRAHFYIKKK